ncbi:hypothetical protein M409DRAFT_69384 [Zasmidium cellare ATCC 36951]|uniref:F-box domain-containing protein n=1 Tax=Zasmidium cellare ATCC 36951 TaxID=1080233 RepID=A0A6A6C7J9_ZASCE|nr:uncharacterized protein M409DRAFT_69384 [Zasmidium cellare ATCC 36951]KAF2162180.1 hypothetical protein M409DRAFT_69384 [Zasmidium cellare ATCC 36951]
MDNRPTNNPLSSVPENPSLDDDDNSSDPWPSHHNAPRRRLQPRQPRFALEPGASSSRTPPAFNLRAQAAEFVPSVTARMPTKRKASSSAGPGKPAASSARSTSLTPDQPIIRGEDLFGRDVLVQKDADSSVSWLDDDEHSEILDMSVQEIRTFAQNNPQAAQQNRDAIREALTLARNRPTEKNKRPADMFPGTSAMLFSCNSTTSTSDQAVQLNCLKYLPLCPAGPLAGRGGTITKDTNLTVLSSYRERLDYPSLRPTPPKRKWPLDELPKEIFDLITDFLDRQDVKSMRLVCREFENMVSDTLFNASVVPFNTELYDMIDEDAKVSTRSSQATPQAMDKGKGRARDAPEVSLDTLHAGLQWQNDKNDVEGKVYRGHGLRVFQGFGPHIKRFGMSFEVAESQLARPPVKKELDLVESYHGGYEWPPQQYTRFANLAGLERTADETLRMKAAFANLTKVQELGLSVESGLGWLNGPDKSLRARIFERPSPVFGQSHARLPEGLQETKDFWAALQACHTKVGGNSSMKEVTLAKRSIAKPIPELPGLQDTQFADPSLWPTVAAANINAATSTCGSPEEMALEGVLFTTISPTESGLPWDKCALAPSELRKEQKEWLLETEWAQRAFLESYILAIIDNPLVVANVRTLNVAKISSSFLPILGRSSFWDALPNLKDVTIHVKPDWRTVEKDNAGFAETRALSPSEAVRSFHKSVLRDRICLRPSITKLNIGWFGGGEHAEGIFARNNNLLPAPITAPEHCIAPAAGFGLVFKFVEELTLHNCWMTPPALEELVRNHSNKSLKKLTLDSVSITTHPRFPTGGQAGQAQAMAAVQAAGVHQPLLNFQNFPNQQAAAQAPGGANVQQNNAMALPPPIVPQNAPQMQQMAFPWHALGMANAPQAGHFQQHVANQLFHHHNQHNPGMLANAGGMNLQAMFGGSNPGNNIQQNPPPPPPLPHLPHLPNHNQQNTHWSEALREGSWPDLLNRISPGPIFDDYKPQPAPWEEQPPPRPETTLQTIELISCGYVRLTNNNAFDQFAIQATDDHHLSVWFRQRQAALSPAMMTTNDRCMARIVQHIPNRELVALLLAWGLREGWADQEKAEESEYDGLLPGGTGRLSGVIEKGMPLMSQSNFECRA